MARKKSKRRSVSQARYKKSYSEKDSGANLGSPLDWKKVKGGVNFYKPKIGRNRVNIIPYEIKTKNHPLVKSGDAEIGDLDYVLDVYIHRSIGPSDTDMVCLKKNFGKPCPVCEEAALYQEKGKKKEFDSLKASRRVFYNVINARKEDAGLEVFTASHFLFEKELIEEAREGVESEEIVDFASIEDGVEVEFRGSEADFGGNSFTKFKSFVFKDRDEELDESLIDDAISFDEILILRSYDEMSSILEGEDADGDDDDDEEEEEKPKKGKSKSKHRDDDDDDEEEEEEEEEEKPKKSKSKSKPKKKPEPEDDDDEEEEEDDDEDDDEEPPKKSKKNSSTTSHSKSKKSKGSDEEDKKPKKGKCPKGYKFGKDCDEHDECDDCKLWDSCSDAQDNG